MRQRDVLAVCKGATFPLPRVICAECGADMALRDSRYGPFWGCVRFPACRGTHGAHPDGRPLGKPATAEVKRLRIAAHESFDATWKGTRSRTAAYRWLARKMKVHYKECHIGSFDGPQCLKVIEYCQRRLATATLQPEEERCQQ